MALRSLKHEFPWHGGETKPTGQVGFQVLRKSETKPETLKQLTARVWNQGAPTSGLVPEVNNWRRRNLPNLWRGYRGVATALAFRRSFLMGSLDLNRIRPDAKASDLKDLQREWRERECRHWLSFPAWCSALGISHQETRFGLASLRVITTVGVGFIVDAFQGIVEPEIMKYHALGTGGTAEAVGDTALVTELTTQYIADNTRATGSLTEGASANIFRSLGTNTVDAAAAITEHGLISVATVGSGVLLDRSLFSVINLANGDSLASTFDLTFSSGG